MQDTYGTGIQENELAKSSSAKDSGGVLLPPEAGMAEPVLTYSQRKCSSMGKTVSLKTYMLELGALIQ